VIYLHVAFDYEGDEWISQFWQAIRITQEGKKEVWKAGTEYETAEKVLERLHQGFPFEEVEVNMANANLLYAYHGHAGSLFNPSMGDCTYERRA
jgi:hypothetical protein